MDVVVTTLCHLRVKRVLTSAPIHLYVVLSEIRSSGLKPIIICQKAWLWANRSYRT